MNAPKAIHHPVSMGQALDQDTLIYDASDGFSWVRLKEGNAEWFSFASTAIGAEREAREAGLNPIAIAYIPLCESGGLVGWMYRNA